MSRTSLETSRLADTRAKGQQPVPRLDLRQGLRGVVFKACLIALGMGLPVWAAAPAKTSPGTADTLIICDSQRPADQQDPDCVEFGAAMGTLGLGWRQQLPGKVRWLMRRDAAELCQQSRSEFGERTSASLKDGCVFVSDQACTIVTPRAASHAELGNAVRNCQP